MLFLIRRVRAHWKKMKGGQVRGHKDKNQMENTLSQSDSLVNKVMNMVDNFSAITMYQAPCKPGFPINSRYCCSIKLPQSRNRTGLWRNYSTNQILMLEKRRGTAECSEQSQVSKAEQQSGSDNDPISTQVAAAGH